MQAILVGPPILPLRSAESGVIFRGPEELGLN